MRVPTLEKSDVLVTVWILFAWAFRTLRALDKPHCACTGHSNDVSVSFVSDAVNDFVVVNV